MAAYRGGWRGRGEVDDGVIETIGRPDPVTAMKNGDFRNVAGTITGAVFLFDRRVRASRLWAYVTSTTPGGILAVALYRRPDGRMGAAGWERLLEVTLPLTALGNVSNTFPEQLFEPGYYVITFVRTAGTGGAVTAYSASLRNGMSQNVQAGNPCWEFTGTATSNPLNLSIESGAVTPAGTVNAGLSVLLT